MLGTCYGSLEICRRDVRLVLSVEIVPAKRTRTTVSAMAHDFTYVTNMTSAAGSHISQARSLAESIHDDSTKQAVRALVEAVGGAVDAINQLVETLK